MNFFYDSALGSPFEPMKQSAAEGVIESVEAFIRSQGKTHRELADLAQVDPVLFTLFMQRKFPADWQTIAVKTESMLRQLLKRIDRESRMPLLTPVIVETLGVVSVLLEDGGIALLQGDSGTGKSEAIKAVSLKFDDVITVQASTARARKKPMLEDIGQRMGWSYYSRAAADTYHAVRSRISGYKLLIIDEVHKYIGAPDCLHVLRDLVNETNVPQLWTATGDLRRYLDRHIGSVRDPFDQIRSRITHTIDLKDAGDELIGPEHIRELAKLKFSLKLEPAAVRELLALARLDNEGSIRLVENALKQAKRLAQAGKLATVDHRLICRCVETSVSKRTWARLQTARPATPTPADPPQQGGIRATA